MRLTSRFTFLGVLVVAASLTALGQELIGGYEGGPGNGYSFGSSVFSIPSTGTNSLVVRPTFSYLYYNYQDTGGFTDVSSPGIGMTLGYRLRAGRLTFTAGPGVETRWEHRNYPNGATTGKTLLGATGMAEAFFQANSLTNLNLIGNYTQNDRYTWVRGGLKRQITNRDFKRSTAWLIGPEVTGQGNRDVRQYQAGGVVELALLPSHVSIQFRSGYGHLQFHDGSTDQRPYFGLGFYTNLLRQQAGPPPSGQSLTPPVQPRNGN